MPIPDVNIARLLLQIVTDRFLGCKETVCLAASSTLSNLWASTVLQHHRLEDREAMQCLEALFAAVT